MAAVGTQLRSANNSEGVSRLSMMQAKLREQLMLEKESRLLEMAARQEAEREDIINRVTKTSASSSFSSSMSSLNSSGAGQGRVRRMFEERRANPRGYHQSPKGYDKSYPLDPVKKEMSRQAVKAVGRGPGRGVSMDRAPAFSDDFPTGRSRSQAPLQRANRGDNRIQKPPKGPQGNRGLPTHHKSTSSLLESYNGYNGHSRGPSPAPPSSTKSSPGPRAPPVATPRRANNPRKPPPPSDNNYLDVNGDRDDYRGSRSPTPTPRESKGFFAKLGFNKSKPETTPSTQRAPNKSKLTVNNKNVGGLSVPSTPRKSIRSPVPDNLKSCKICSRNFAPDRIEKHEAICAKSKMKDKKRKVFDPVKMRTQGTEAEKFVARGDHLKENKKAKKNNWRKKHEDFIKTVRAAKGMQGYEAPPIDTSDYIECPHCGRKFSEKAADRHIPKCKDISSNKVRKDPPHQQKAPPRRRR